MTRRKPKWVAFNKYKLRVQCPRKPHGVPEIGIADVNGKFGVVHFEQKRRPVSAAKVEKEIERVRKVIERKVTLGDGPAFDVHLAAKGYPGSHEWKLHVGESFSWAANEPLSLGFPVDANEPIERVRAMAAYITYRAAKLCGWRLKELPPE